VRFKPAAAGRAVRNEPYWIELFTRRTDSNQNRFPDQILGYPALGQQLQRGGDNTLRFIQTSRSNCAAGHLARVGLNYMHTVASQTIQIALRCRMLQH